MTVGVENIDLSLQLSSLQKVGCDEEVGYDHGISFCVTWETEGSRSKIDTVAAVSRKV